MHICPRSAAQNRPKEEASQVTVTGDRVNRVCHTHRVEQASASERKGVLTQVAAWMNPDIIPLSEQSRKTNPW